MRSAIFSLLVLIFWPTSITATLADKATVEVADKWGLLGTWAPDCNKPAARQNVYYTYKNQADQLVVSRNGGDYQDSNVVAGASLVADDQLSLTTSFQAYRKTMTSVYVKKSPSKFQNVSNKDQTGHYTVRDGKLTGSGAPTPLMTRCFTPMS